jgi:hypothetical protein
VRQKNTLLIGAFLLQAYLFPAFGQEYTFITNLKKSLDRFYNTQRNHTIILSFHQPKYMPGDTVFFHGFIVNGSTRKIDNTKKNVTLKLIGPGNKVFVFNKFLFEAGQCSNQFILPRDLSMDVYKLIGFTDEMMDEKYVPQFLYDRDFVIGGEKVKSSDSFSNLQYFVEGGNLMEGLRNKLVAVTSMKNESARIIRRDGLVVADAIIDNFGSASFSFVPEINEEYFIQSGGNRATIKQAKNSGISLSITTEKKESMDVLLQTPNDALTHQDFYLVLSQLGDIFYSKKINFETTVQQHVSVPLTHGKTGLFRLTLFSSTYEVIAERVLGIEPEKIEVEIMLSKDSFNTRQAVHTSISIKNDRSFSGKPSFTMSVFSKALFEEEKHENSTLGSLSENNINLMLWPEVFSEMPPEVQQNFLIASLAKVTPWSDILSYTNNAVSHANGRRDGSSYFKGRAVYAADSRPVPDSSFITFYLNKNDFIYGTYTNKGGLFMFPLFMNFGDEEIFFSIESKGRTLKDAKLEIDEGPVGKKWTATTEKLSMDPYVNFIKQQRQISKSYTYYDNDDIKKMPQEQVDPQDEWEGDYTVELEKFEPFFSMQEVLTNILPGVQYKPREERIRVFLKHTAAFASANPLYVIDGVMTNNTSYFLSLDPAQIAKIILLRSDQKLSRFGTLGKNGILVIVSKFPDPKSIPRSEKTIFITGQTLPIPFHLPHYTQDTNNRKPDLRCSLYWGSFSRQQAAKVNFFVGDATGIFKIRVEGLTDEGVFFSKEVSFAVFYKRLAIK